MWRFGNYEIDFANVEQWRVIVPVMAIIAVLSGVLYATERRLISFKAGLLLTGLRLALVAVLAAALLDLRIREVQDDNESLRRRVVVAVDTSWSMDLPDPQMGDAARLRAADAAGLLSPGMRAVKLESLPTLLGIIEGRLGELAENLRLLSESLNVRLDGPHPRAVAAETEIRILTAVHKMLEEKLAALVGEKAAGVPESVRGPLTAGRDGAIKKVGLVLASAGKLPLAADSMLKRQDAGDLNGLAKECQEFLQVSAMPELRRSVAALRLQLRELADKVDAETVRQGGTALAEKLEAAAQSSRRGLVRQVLGRDQSALLKKLEDAYKVKFVVFDEKPIELDTAAAAERLARPETAPVNEEREAKVRAELANRATAANALSAAYTDFDPMLRLAGRGANPLTVAAVVVFSDGISNPAPSRKPTGEFGGLRTLAGRLGIPIICVPAGGEAGEEGGKRGFSDVRIVSIEEPRSVFRKSEAEVWVNYACTNVPAGTELNFQLLEDGKPVEGSFKNLPAEEFGRVNFKLDTERTGVRNFTVEVKPIAGELIKTNNRRSFAVQVTDSKLRVLVVAEDPGWEWRFVKDTLERDKERLNVDSVVFTPGELGGAEQRDAAGQVKPWGKYPPTLDELYKYDVIVMGDIDPRGRFFREPDHLKNLLKYVRDRGGSLILSPGKKYMAGRRVLSPEAREEFEALLPVVLPAVDDPRAAIDDGASAKTPLNLVPTDEGKRDVICRLADKDEENGEIWRGFPPHYWRIPTTDVKPGAAVLVTIRPNAGPTEGTAVPAGDDAAPAKREFERKNPIISHHRNGLGRVMTVGVQTTWRMRNKVGDRYHSRLWGQIVRWAAPGGWPVGNEFVQLRGEKLKYQAGEPVRVEVRLIDKEGKPIDRKKVEPELLAYSGDPANKIVAETVKLTYVEDSAGLWRAEFRNLRDGRYSVMPALGKGQSVPEPGWALPETGLPVELGNAGTGDAGLPPETQAELTRLSRDPADPSDVLNTLASASGGMVLDLHSADALPGILAALEKPIDHLRQRAEETGVRWGLWLLLGLFVIIVTAEWVARKRIGLI